MKEFLKVLFDAEVRLFQLVEDSSSKIFSARYGGESLRCFSDYSLVISDVAPSPSRV